MQSKTNYSIAQISLHWLIALLIGANYIISDDMPEYFDRSLQGAPVTGFTPAFHVYAGMAVMGLVLLRLAVRFWQGTPAPAGHGTLADKAAGAVHLALYALMIAVPALGAISWYGGIEGTGDLHVLAMNAMMILALGHALAAIVHQFWLKDGLMDRMTRTN